MKRLVPETSSGSLYGLYLGIESFNDSVGDIPLVPVQYSLEMSLDHARHFLDGRQSGFHGAVVPSLEIFSCKVNAAPLVYRVEVLLAALCLAGLQLTRQCV